MTALLARHESLLTRGLSAASEDSRGATVFVASVPLTGEGWSPLPEGAVLALRQGAEVARVLP